MSNDNEDESVNRNMSMGSVHLSDESSSDDNFNWQQVPAKRRNAGSPKIYRQRDLTVMMNLRDPIDSILLPRMT